MNIDTTFINKRREQLIKFERSVLRELSVNILKKSIQQYFGALHTGVGVVFDQAMEEGLYDVALEVYLLGSSYSRIGYYGEPFEEVKSRCEEELSNFSNAIYDFIIFWGNIPEQQDRKHLKYKCEQYIEHWFHGGFTKGKMKYKMRMH